MLTIRHICVAVALLTLSAASVLAIDLQNQDDKKYEVKITQGATTSDTSIEANTTVGNIASGDAEIEVVGVGTIKASGQDTVLIKDGKVSKK
jgi:hypothetical protein